MKKIILTISLYFLTLNSSFSQIRINNEASENALYNIKYIRDSESDTNSFKEVRIYSLEKDKNKLIIPLIKSIGLIIQYYPGKGHLEIKKPGFRQVFDFGETYAPEKNYCREYYIRVIDASSSHMVLEKYCTPFEIMKNIYEQDVHYILYDMESAEMKIIYIDIANDKDTKYPFIKKDPEIKKINNGYNLDWIFTTKTDQYNWDVNIKYIKKFNKEKKAYLLCSSKQKVGNVYDKGDLCSFGFYDLIYKNN
ncbi:hypothetical protein RGU70_05745 [Herbaspirillum sp. RTI4]|uniref:hypothetical protein n=1 Tax=Herbaspirillum sp. RTI4 TaxID=3048640 RepID=UPI002AB46873|nr:hypothetical protein [Herbaspirillum sp. RTI4]MDY7577821.1 hypothetical protein [Herbaspirillum sp. RTI4]